MDPADQTALFRSHAMARLRGDTDEAARLAAQITPDLRMAHTIFVMSFFTLVVAEELGDRPDPWDLSQLTKRLHDKHFLSSPNFNALRAEAMVRAVCGDPFLLNEIPQTEQIAYMWAVLGELVDPADSDADFAERFDIADEVRADWMNGAAASGIFAVTSTDPPSDTPSDSGSRA